MEVYERYFALSNIWPVWGFNITLFFVALDGVWICLPVCLCIIQLLETFLSFEA